MSTTTEEPVPAVRQDPTPPADGEDRRQWRTIYRGRGVPRQVGAVVEVTLTPEQKAWLDAIAAERGLTLVEAVSSAIDLARTNATG
jgi:hypothetical protein